MGIRLKKHKVTRPHPYQKVCGVDESRVSHPRYSKERLLVAAAQFSNKMEWRAADENSMKAAQAYGRVFYKLCTAHMPNRLPKRFTDGKPIQF